MTFMLGGGIRKRLFLITGLFIVAFTATAVFAFFGLRALGVSAQSSGDAKDAVADIVPPPLNLLEPYLITYQLTEDLDVSKRSSQLARLHELETMFKDREQVWRDRFAKRPELLSLLDTHATVVHAFLKDMDSQFIPAIEAGDIARARQIRQEVLQRQYRENTVSEAAFTTAMNNWCAEELKAFASAQRGVQSQQVVSFLVMMLLSGTLFVTVRGMVREMQSVCTELRLSSSEVASASGHVSTTAQSLSQGAISQAASIEETSASMEEMASMTRQNADNSAEAARLMQDAGQAVDRSNRVLHEMVSSMQNIRESSDKVSRIIKTIDEIAFQTNILALNAAVEAARAGEAGMGFAVVADEVRNLAQRSAQAASDTATLIEESINNAQQGAARVADVEQAISGITGSVTRVKALVEQVSEASREQSQGIDQVSGAISRMENVTQTTAASAEESAAASEELSAQAESALAGVRRLEALMFGSVGTIADSAPAAASGPRKLITLPSQVSAKPRKAA